MDPPQALVDSEGYSIPPVNHDQSPWEQNQHVANIMDDDDDSNPPFVPDAQPPLANLKLATAPIQETEEERRAALARVQSTLLAPSPGGPQRRGTLARGRRDVRNTTFGLQGVPDDMPLGQAMAMGAYGGGGRNDGGSLNSRSGSMLEDQQNQASPISSSFSTAPLPNNITTSGTNVFESPMSASPTTFTPNPNNPFSNGSPNPILSPSAASSASSSTSLGLSISEICNVVARAGLIAKAMVAGEIAIALPLSLPAHMSSTEPLHIRIDAFEQLEKVAPNPQFVRPFSSERAGEYLLDLAALQTAASTRAVLFKYQLHVGEGKASTLVPINVVPQWKTEDLATKLLITYSSNLSSRLFSKASDSPFEQSNVGSTGSSPTIEGIAFTVPITSPSGITKPQSKPFPGVWDASAKTIVYPGETLSGAEGEKKIVARMSVQEPSVPQPIQAKWSVRGGLCSTLGISVVLGRHDGGESGEDWKVEEVRKVLQSGKFILE